MKTKHESSMNKGLDHKKYMREAISVARTGVRRGQSPFGCVIVNKKTGEVIARAHNTVLKDKDPTAHAEINAIRLASRKTGLIHLKGYALYSTLEPCPMCFSAIHWAHIDDLYYGASIEDAERCGFREMNVHNKLMKRLGGKHVKVNIHPNILREECLLMMEEWMKNPKRKTY